MSAMLNLSRRSLLRGLFAAPAIVAVGNIMPVRLFKAEPAVEKLIWSTNVPPGIVGTELDDDPIQRYVDAIAAEHYRKLGLAMKRDVERFLLNLPSE
jgi:hypothetical protein